MAVRSKTLFGNSMGTNIVKLLYTTPADRTAIVKSLTMGGSAGAIVVSLFADDPAGASRFIGKYAIAAGESVQLNGLYWVLEPGRKFQCSSTGGGVITGHGVLLDGAPE